MDAPLSVVSSRSTDEVFGWRPTIIATSAWAVTVLPSVVLVPSDKGPELEVFAFLGASGIALCLGVLSLIAVFRLRPKRGLSLVVAMALFGGCHMASLRDDVRLVVRSPYYLMKIWKNQGAEQPMSWPWDGGMGWWKSLVYYEHGDQWFPSGERTRANYVGDGTGCIATTRPLIGHFYMNTTICGQ